jgi:hypothetical protein
VHTEVLAEIGSDGLQFRIDRKLLRATVPTEMFFLGNLGTAGNAVGHLDLFYDVEAQERFADNDFVAITEHLTLSRRQSLATVDERPVRRSQIF